MGANKRLSLIPTWKLMKKNLLQVEQIEPDIVQDTNIDDENPRLKEIHKTRAPVLFKAESSWGSQFGIGTSPQAQTLVQEINPDRVSSRERLVIGQVNYLIQQEIFLNFQNLMMRKNTKTLMK
ncbi:hypothetical protein pb186bvf_005923 [Paramecium bursaria]